MSLIRANTEEDAEIKSHHIAKWEKYAAKQTRGEVTEQTKLFFAQIPVLMQHAFTSSTKRILQLGMAAGNYMGKIVASKERQCIGYDLTKTAVTAARKNGLTARQIDLNEVADDNQLAYQSMLTEDLVVPADIVAIRVLEYLDPKTIIPLIFALINTAQPGSMFYFETLLIKNYKFPKGHMYDIASGYIASFFAPRIDIQFRHYSVNDEFDATHKLVRVADDGVEIEVEAVNNRLIVTKL